MTNQIDVSTYAGFDDARNRYLKIKAQGVITKADQSWLYEYIDELLAQIITLEDAAWIRAEGEW